MLSRCSRRRRCWSATRFVARSPCDMAAALRFAPLAREPLRPKYIKIRRKEFHERGTHEFCDMVVVRFIPGPPPSGCHGEHHALAVLKGDGERGRTIDATGFLRETRHQRADISSVAQVSGVEWMSACAEVAAACAQSRDGSNGRAGRFEVAGKSGGKAGAGAGVGPGLLSGGGLPRNALDASKVVARVRGEIGGLARLCGASRRLRGNRALHRAAAGSSVSLYVPGVSTR